tara:strand:+ start:9736 stop:10653 length:918 start_codon:yes stop_codon:yes gene_type:complete
MEMFHPDSLLERIGPDLLKAKNLRKLIEVEEYALDKIKNKYNWEYAYDVIANEVPYFKTMGYTEYATNFLLQPLTLSLRDDSIKDAYYDTTSEIFDYAQMFRNNVDNNIANKYQKRSDSTKEFPTKKILVVLPGTNKIKKNVCLNKLKAIKKKYGEGVNFKPHPITMHATIGELKDLFGEDCILPRNADMYLYMKAANKVYTTHMSESAVYALALGKTIEPIDVHNEVQTSSFYSINSILFRCQSEGDEAINRIFSSYKSGIVNIDLEKDWKKKLDKYFEYANLYRESCKGWYIIRDKKDEQKEV